ncbi:C39 family peptidase [Deinococcus ruber]|uniref:C39 family peptidase n=1 Tax=Deinococcus ruber TaxID=1848197 RepID=UPI001665CCC9|nr:C39 family peptidase [Deinococcus ruber]
MKFPGYRLVAALLMGGLLSAGAGRAAAPAASAAHPVSAYLAAVGHVHQTYNNCGPASVVSVLDYYGIETDQAQVARVLRPSGGYMLSSVIAPFVQHYGLRASRFRNGNLEHLRRLTAAGIPVIVLQWMNRVGGIPHFRVVRGYDDRTGLMWLSDPIYGPNVYVSYANFLTLWTLAGQEFIPVYRPEQTALVGRILGVKL